MKDRSKWHARVHVSAAFASLGYSPAILAIATRDHSREAGLSLFYNVKGDLQS